MGSNTTSTKTSYYLDMEAIRKAFRTERAVRGTSLKDMESWMRIEGTRLASFSTGASNLGGDALVTVVMWMGHDLRKYIGKRVAKTPAHRDTYDQKQLRVAEGYLAKAGLRKEDGESAVDAMIRIIGELKAAGVELEAQE